MKRITLLIAAMAIATMANAGNGQPGGHFVENWDGNEDGQVTLEEATERRGDIFVTFDENDDGFISAEEYMAFDEARAADHEGENAGAGKRNGRRASVGMELDFNDVDNDGRVSREEFLARTADWFAILDRNGDGVVTTGDFGPQG